MGDIVLTDGTGLIPVVYDVNPKNRSVGRFRLGHLASTIKGYTEDNFPWIPSEFIDAVGEPLLFLDECSQLREFKQKVRSSQERFQDLGVNAYMSGTPAAALNDSKTPVAVPFQFYRLDINKVREHWRI